MSESFTFRGADISEGAVYKVAATVPITSELLADASLMWDEVDRSWRFAHPWEFADRNPFPNIDPVPPPHPR